MKKILTIIIALVAFTWAAAAQISIKKSDSGKPKQMTTLSMSWSWIYQADESYYIVMKSDNQFDDTFWLRIGKSKDECIESITSLQELAETIVDTDRFEIDNGEGEVFNVTQYNVMGAKGLRFHGKGYAGSGFLLSSNLKKAHKWIEKNVN